MVIKKEEFKIILELQESLTLKQNISEFFDLFLNKSMELVQSEFSGIVLFNNQENKVNITASNNPDDFVNAYHKDLFKYDFLMDRIIENPHEIYNYRTDMPLNKKERLFVEEAGKVRSKADAIYDPIMLEGRIIGFDAHVKPAGNYHFTEKDYYLQKMLKNFLINSYRYYTQKSKIELLQSSRYSEEIFFHFYLWSNGEIDIPDNSDHDMACKVLDINKVTPANLLKNKVVSNIMESINQDNKNLSLQVIAEGRGYNVNALLINEVEKEGIFYYIFFSIEKQKTLYNYELFRNQFTLTKREIEIVALIVQGKSNRAISDSLFISEATVKRHIANIFEKVMIKSRTQLISSLTMMQ